ncbi:DUF4387 domain-containing protein [Gordonia humi]|uniref:DUF4387 domain-containing protein n=1 Tax=Gordonia humi TaxID=686429 RepID=A0A840F671_9ACTN|nr:DUF4387 domain-containing protein [Gordonia humi]MBB4138164.1 hypothetical protein [Gordonia humi]
MPNTLPLRQVATKIRSKNAGPFWITIDLFFSTDEAYATTVRSGAITRQLVADLYGVDHSHIKLFELPDIRAIKVSYPRVTSQGSIHDRDIHAAQQYIPLLDIAITQPDPEAPDL